jgi:hypothetical protein
MDFLSGFKQSEKKQRVGEGEKEKKWKKFLDGTLSHGRLPVLVFVLVLFLIGWILFLRCVYGALGRHGLREAI